MFAQNIRHPPPGPNASNPFASRGAGEPGRNGLHGLACGRLVQERQTAGSWIGGLAVVSQLPSRAFFIVFWEGFPFEANQSKKD